jgi:hypothetical protein
MNFWLRSAGMMSCPTATIVHYNCAVDVGAINTIMNAIGSVGYEPEENMPVPAVITQAARSLCTLPMEKAEISPFYGEVNVTWKNGLDRVKATFGPEPNIFYVYKECFDNGRVTYNHLESNPDVQYLHDSLNWLATHHAANV